MLKFFYYAMFRPAVRRQKFTPIRDILRWPVIFDILSLIAQIRDLRRTAAILKEYAVDDPHHRKVQDYNAGVTLTKQFTRTRRAEEYYGVVAQPLRDLSNERLLIVGPRNIHELLIAWLHGFSEDNIEAIDLYSTNPKIHVMNMEATSYPDARFDAVVMSNTLSYAADTAQTIWETARILKLGGRFVFSATYDPGSPDFPGDWIRGGEIVKMLKNAGLRPYFHVAYDKVNSRGRNQTSHTFGAQKLDPAAICLDPVNL